MEKELNPPAYISLEKAKKLKRAGVPAGQTKLMYAKRSNSSVHDIVEQGFAVQKYDAYTLEELGKLANRFGFNYEAEKDPDVMVDRIFDYVKKYRKCFQYTFWC